MECEGEQALERETAKAPVEPGEPPAPGLLQHLIPCPEHALPEPRASLPDRGPLDQCQAGPSCTESTGLTDTVLNEMCSSILDLKKEQKNVKPKPRSLAWSCQ